MPGALALGDLNSTTSVRIGLGGAIVVDNSGTSATGSVSIAGPLSLASLNAGTNPLTCGTLSCASVASTGNVTQPRYSIRVFRNFGLSIAAATSTVLTWDTIETAGGGATNWPFTPPSGILSVPVAGRYLVTYVGSFAANATGYRDFWAEVNSGGAVGATRRYGETTMPAVSGAVTGASGSFTYQFAAGDQLVFGVFQNSGGSLGLSTGNQGNSMTITRLSE